MLISLTSLSLLNKQISVKAVFEKIRTPPMRYLFLLLCFFMASANAQQKDNTISISCYVNPELYMDAGVIAHISDRTGNISCSGSFVCFTNKSNNVFYYQLEGSWTAVKPQERKIVSVLGLINPAAKSSTIIRLPVRYSTDLSGSITTKIKTIDELNAKSDQSKAGGGVTVAKSASSTKSANPAVKTNNNPYKQPAKQTSKTDIEDNEGKQPKENLSAKTVSNTSVKKSRPASTERRQSTTKSRTYTRHSNAKATTQRSNRSGSERVAYKNALGLRVDFGTDDAGFGPNLKHAFNNRYLLDASLVFFPAHVVGLGAQFEKSFPVKTDPGLSLYAGIGPQFLFGKESTAFTIVPVGGVEYIIPKTPLNLSFDWMPALFLTPDARAEAGRFGLSVRIIF